MTKTLAMSISPPFLNLTLSQRVKLIEGQSVRAWIHLFHGDRVAFDWIPLHYLQPSFPRDYPLYQWCDINLKFQSMFRDGTISEVIELLRRGHCKTLAHFDNILHDKILFHWSTIGEDEILQRLKTLESFLIIFGTMPALPRDCIIDFRCWQCKYDSALKPPSAIIDNCTHLCRPVHEEVANTSPASPTLHTNSPPIGENIPAQVQMKLRQLNYEKRKQALILKEIRLEKARLESKLKRHLAPKVLTLNVFEKYGKICSYFQRRLSTRDNFHLDAADVTVNDSAAWCKLKIMLSAVTWSECLRNRVMDLFFRLSVDPYTLNKTTWRLETTYRMWRDAGGSDIYTVCDYLDKLTDKMPNYIMHEEPDGLFKCCYVQCLLDELSRTWNFQSPRAYRCEEWQKDQSGWIYLYNEIGVSIADSTVLFSYTEVDKMCLTWLFHATMSEHHAIHRHIFSENPLTASGDDPLYFPLTLQLLNVTSHGR